ncbi:MAG: hypothetical protein FWF51_08190, partial [Chitinivibrionia bacterium]|nr:hypothetical protein [Chitinivibrionia bacterium]
HSTAQHSTAQHSTAQHSTAQHSTAQHSTLVHIVRRKNFSFFHVFHIKKLYPKTSLNLHHINFFQKPKK